MTKPAVFLTDRKSIRVSLSAFCVSFATFLVNRNCQILIETKSAIDRLAQGLPLPHTRPSARTGRTRVLTCLLLGRHVSYVLPLQVAILRF